MPAAGSAELAGGDRFLRRERAGWLEGEYRVEFYSADDAMAEVAAGRYVIDPGLGALE